MWRKIEFGHQFQRLLLHMEGLDEEKEEDDKGFVETGECKVIAGKTLQLLQNGVPESQLHFIQAVKFEDRTETAEEHSTAANTATLQLLHEETQRRKKERRINQAVKARIG